jgi:ABC-type antimicrobial peptide transport system permease subunit
VVSLVGLIIALSMLAGCLFYMETIRADVYLEGMNKFKGFSFSFSAYGGSGDEISAQQIALIKNSIDSSLSTHQLDMIANIESFSPMVSLYSNKELKSGNSSSSCRLDGLRGINESILVNSEVGSRLPENSNEILLFARENSSINLNDQVNVSLALFYYTSDHEEVNITINLLFTVVGIIDVDPPYDISGYFFFMDHENFLLLIQDVNQKAVNIDSEWHGLEYQVTYEYHIAHEKITRENVVEVINNFVAWNGEFNWYSFPTDLSHGRGTTGSSPFYLVADIDNVFRLFILLSSPVLLLVALLILFSLSTIDTLRLKSLALLKTRGFSNRFTFLLLVTETLIVLFLATIVAAVIGIPLAMVASTSTGFLTFNIDKITVVPTVLWDIFIELLIMGLFISLLTHARSLVQLSRSSIITLEEEASRKKLRRKKVLKGQLDLLLMVIGVSGIITTYLFYRLLELYSVPEMNLVGNYDRLVLLMGFLSTMAFLVGAILCLNRFVPVILHLAGDFFLDKNWRLLGIVTRNLNTNVRVTTRTTLLVAISFSFLVLLISLPLSGQQHLEETIIYDQGCDVVIESYPSSMYDQDRVVEIEQSVLDELETISGLMITRVARVTIYTEYYNIELIGIDDNFQQVAHNGESLTKMVNDLFQSPYNDTIIIDSLTAVREQIRMNSTYEIQSTDYEFTVKGVTSYWPSLIKQTNNFKVFLVGRYDMVKNLTIERGRNRAFLWGKILPGNDPQQVLSELEDKLTTLNYHEYEYTFTTVLIEKVKNSPEIAHFWVTININILTAFTIVVTVIILFIFARMIVRRRESGLSRSLGMKMHQVFLLQFTEPFILLLMGWITGGIITVVSIAGLQVISLTVTKTGLQFFIDMHLPVIMATVIVILIVTAFIALITSFIAMKMNISEVLKAET